MFPPQRITLLLFSTVGYISKEVLWLCFLVHSNVSVFSDRHMVWYGIHDMGNWTDDLMHLIPYDHDIQLKLKPKSQTFTAGYQYCCPT